MPWMVSVAISALQGSSERNPVEIGVGACPLLVQIFVLCPAGFASMMLMVLQAAR